MTAEEFNSLMPGDIVRAINDSRYELLEYTHGVWKARLINKPSVINKLSIVDIQEVESPLRGYTMV